MRANPDKSKKHHHQRHHGPSSSQISSPVSSSSSPSSSEGSSSSEDLNPSDALQSPLTGLLNFEGFSMPQMRNFGISNIDMPNFPNLPNLPSLPTLPSFNMPRFPQRLPDLRLPDLANNLSMNLTNLQNLRPSMPNFPNLPNLPNLSQLTNGYTSAELQNLFNLFRISTNLPALPQLPPIFSPGQFSRGHLVKPWPHLRNSVRNMHRRLNDITQRYPTNFHFCEWQTADGIDFIRTYFILNNCLHFCDTPVSDQQHNNVGNGNSPNNEERQSSPSTSSGSGKHHHPSDNYNDRNNHNQKQDLRNTQPLHPCPLIVDNFNHVDCYEYDPKSSRFVYSIRSNILYFEDQPGLTPTPQIPSRVETKCPYSKTDPKICPSNPDLVAYHCNGDLWCVNLKTSQEVMITNLTNSNSHESHLSELDEQQRNSQPRSPNGSFGLSPSPSQTFEDSYCPDAAEILVGRPNHVIREEFKRHQAFWWKPETDYHVVHDSEDYSEYSLLFEETDQSKVDIINIASWDGSIEGQRFPRAGKRNAVSRLKLAKFKLASRSAEIYDVSVSDLVTDFKRIFPEHEYLLRIGWLGQEAVWCQLLNRRQTHLVLAIISLTGTFESQIIYEEKNETYWVGVHDIIYFLNAPKIDNQPLTAGTELTFIWSSEETGYRHMYLVKVELTDGSCPAKRLLKKQLTDGQWEINEKEFWVNEEEMLIYFCGLRDTPLEKHLYVLSYSDGLHEKHRRHHQHGRIKIHRLSELNYAQSSIAFNANCSIFINIQSNISVPPFGFVNLIIPQTKYRKDNRRLPDSKRLAILLVNSSNYSIFETSHLDYLRCMGSRPSIIYDCQADLLPGLAKPELFCCQLTNGELIYGSVFKPEFMESGVRYPTVLEIYGGPEVQLVSNSFMNLRQPTRHLLSSEGYVVVIIDCRGSGRRGQKFEAHSHRRMGQVEIADQIEVLKWLADNTGYIDLGRIAVKGWSYGGYLALMALAQFPLIFKIAIAGAPVTDWKMYDSAYTERFMGLPSENPDGYQKGCVLNYVHQFPDQKNRLLILHGLMDENVHFTHTATLIKALVEAGKPYDLQIFPVERHILKHPTSCENYTTCILSYLQLNL